MLINKIIKGLHLYAGCDIVPTDTSAPKPPYPYMSYKAITALNNPNGFSLIDTPVPSVDSSLAYDVEVTRREQAQFNLSFSAYSLDDSEAMSLAVKAADWFRFTGYAYLKQHDLIVIHVSAVGERTVQIVDEYERRYGFDVRFRVAREIKKRIEAIEDHSLILTKGGKKDGKK